MKYDFFEVMYTVIDVFNNRIGYVSIFVAIVLCVIICKFCSFKLLVLGVIISGIASALTFAACIVGNTPDYLWIVIFLIPIFVALTTVFIFRVLVKLLIKNNTFIVGKDEVIAPYNARKKD